MTPLDPYLSTPTHWNLPVDEVHVWRIGTTPLPDDFEELRAILSRDERDKADRFHFDADRNRHTIGRGWLRRLLGRCLDEPAEKVVFEYGRQGKPSLTRQAANPTRRVTFNLAHSHECILLALAWDNPLGIDVEFVRPMPEALTIGRRHFTPSECRLIQGATQERDETFFRLWTRKEAVIKAVGTGLVTPLNRFDVSSAAPAKEGWLAVSVDEQPPTTWAVCDLPAANGYCAAIALEQRPANLCFWQGTRWSD